jgi:hypothetical protein
MLLSKVMLHILAVLYFGRILFIFVYYFFRIIFGRYIFWPYYFTIFRLTCSQTLVIYFLHK